MNIILLEVPHKLACISQAHCNVLLRFKHYHSGNLWLFTRFFFFIFIADCPAGSYSSLNRTCSLCPRGTYQPSRGRPYCIFCGQNLTTSSAGTADRNHCIGKQSLFSMTIAGWRSQLNTIRLTSASALHTDISVCNRLKTAFLDSFSFS